MMQVREGELAGVGLIRGQKASFVPQNAVGNRREEFPRVGLNNGAGRLPGICPYGSALGMVLWRDLYARMSGDIEGSKARDSDVTCKRCASMRCDAGSAAQDDARSPGSAYDARSGFCGERVTERKGSSRRRKRIGSWMSMGSNSKAMGRAGIMHK